MRTEIVEESRDTTLTLSEAEAAALVEVGRDLASDTTWWGESEVPEGRSVIQCTPHGGGRWRVRVVDAVGLISTGALQLEVRPKIPVPHLLYLFGESGQIPRQRPEIAQALAGQSLWPMVAGWYLLEMEALLRKDLMRDYQDEEGWLTVIRGRVDLVRTVRALSSGRVEALCQYEVFGADTALNRILLAAAHRVAASPVLCSRDRRRALSIVARMDDVGAFQHGDLRARTDRRTGYYANALSLARHIIAGQGRTIAAGTDYARTFLIRTPEMVEEGIRQILRRGLGHRWRIEKQRRTLAGTPMTFNPDLVVDDGRAVADVKYKVLATDWARPDLYQIIAFAVAFRTDTAAVIGFSRGRSAGPHPIRVGDIAIAPIIWDASTDRAPQAAGAQLCQDVGQWLSAAAPDAPGASLAFHRSEDEFMPPRQHVNTSLSQHGTFAPFPD